MSSVAMLDEAVLAAYLEANVPGFKGPLSASKFPGGQSNPTFRIDADSGTYVLRRQPPGKLLKSAHAVDREYRVLAALRDTDVPVAEVYHLCEDTAVIGSMFYLMQYCDGNVYWNPALGEIDDPNTRGAMYDQMARTLASIHSVDLESAGLADYGRPGNYFQRQLGRWTSQYRASELGKIESMNRLISYLEANLPADDGQVALVHGDFRLDNLMYAKDNSRVIAVLDWELSTLGHPCADLAYQCMAMRLPASERQQMAPVGLAGLDLQPLGLPGEEQYIASYCQYMGIDHIDNWNFFLAFSFFRLAAIAQGVAKRATQGNASNASAREVGDMVDPLASMALEIVA
ncbi:phosphotransferase [Pseudohalioglobus sediminis]|uniref:Phosphotransferase n=1 Tax=Pseudohalioglobus sediminis TaxID=2606449 RepID=A0A5B0X1Q5_9GAMM|nr:phosphotransferase [Pseudohalioglobus sediminis]KAA1193226.1 phosphotransferase [Pseudohalioglobus sediminis]